MAVMDTEEKIRLALQVLVAVVLWTSGFYLLALIATVVIVPWKPFYEASAWLVEPIIKWRVSKPSKSLDPVSYAQASAGLTGLEQFEHSDA